MTLVVHRRSWQVHIGNGVCLLAARRGNRLGNFRADRELKQIGVIHSPHTQAAGTPVQASLAAGVEGTVEVFPQFVPGLKDLEGFERIWLVYWFDRAKEPQLVVTPYLDTMPHGLFATRPPCRPNPIGLSIVRLLEVRDNLLRVDGLDVLDTTPLLDIKPKPERFRLKRGAPFGGLGM